LPPGDLLLHCGDSSWDGTKAELITFADWFRSQPHKHKCFIAGNHDSSLQYDVTPLVGITYLLDREVTLEGLRIYGTPYRVVPDDRLTMKSKKGVYVEQRWSAFMVNETWAEHIFADIPNGLDILMTHIPPYGILDSDDGLHWGSKALLKAVERAKPRHHFFGHVHSDGAKSISNEHTTFVNAAQCYPSIDKKHTVIRSDVLVFDIEPRNNV